MILSVNDYLNIGLPLSSDISESECELAIKTFEQFSLKSIIGTELYTAIVGDTIHEYDDIVNGTDAVAGLKLAIAHGVFASMLYDSIRLTRYGSVAKRSDESENPKRDDILAVAKQHAEISLAFIYEVCEFADVKPNRDHNSFIFTELV